MKTNSNQVRQQHSSINLGKSKLSFQSYKLLLYVYVLHVNLNQRNKICLNQQHLRCNYAKIQLKKKKIIFWYVLNFPIVTIFWQFYYSNDRERNGTFTEKCDALGTFSISVKSGTCWEETLIWCTNLHQVKCYDKTNMNVFAFNLWEKISWGLTYFGQFICCSYQEISLVPNSVTTIFWFYRSVTNIHLQLWQKKSQPKKW